MAERMTEKVVIMMTATERKALQALADREDRSLAYIIREGVRRAYGFVPERPQ